MGLASVSMSGSTPICSYANSEPVRPIPHWISSKIECDLPLARERVELADEAAVQHAHAALALHRLEDDRRHGLRIEDDGEIVDVALDDGHAAGERTERRAIARPIRRGERREQPPVKCAAERDDVGLRRAHRRCAPISART